MFLKQLAFCSSPSLETLHNRVGGATTVRQPSERATLCSSQGPQNWKIGFTPCTAGIKAGATSCHRERETNTNPVASWLQSVQVVDFDPYFALRAIFFPGQFLAYLPLCLVLPTASITPKWHLPLRHHPNLGIAVLSIATQRRGHRWSCI